MIQRTVFISYRRVAPFHARAVYQHLSSNGYDVFMDVERMDSGAFDELLLRQIAARAHFVLLLTPGALDRCANPNDWLRREIEHAIDMKRNIVPVMFDGFDWSVAIPLMAGKLTALQHYNTVRIPKENEYFEPAMERLKRFLNVEADAVIHPTLAADKPIVAQRKAEVEAAPTVTEEALTAEQYAAQAYEQNLTKSDEAITAATKVGYSVEYNNRGIAFDSKGDYDQAIADFNEAIRLNPNYAAAYHNRGYAFDSKGDYNRAIADFNEAIRLNPNYTAAYHNRGYTFNNKGDYNRAIADFNEAIRLDPKLANAHNHRGFAYYKKGYYSQALLDLNEAIRLNPKYAQAYHRRAEVYRMLDRLAEAAADEREAERLDGK